MDALVGAGARVPGERLLQVQLVQRTGAAGQQRLDLVRA